MRTVVVTRHPALIEYLIEIGLIDTQTRVIEHATRKDVLGNRVVGNIPLELAALATTVVTVPLGLPRELRGVELSLEQVRQYAGEPREYRVCQEDHGLLNKRAIVRQMREAVPEYEGDNEHEAMSLLLGQWAERHGLVQTDNNEQGGLLSESVIREMLELQRIPMPKLTKRVQVCIAHGVPVLTVLCSLGHCTSCRSYRARNVGRKAARKEKTCNTN